MWDSSIWRFLTIIKELLFFVSEHLASIRHLQEQSKIIEGKEIIFWVTIKPFSFISRKDFKKNNNNYAAILPKLIENASSCKMLDRERINERLLSNFKTIM